jgi:hypothetical protein
MREWLGEAGLSSRCELFQAMNPKPFLMPPSEADSSISRL